jgi:imidazole glycerol phosphate synthase glutamine amidotransferase subunit
VIPRAPVAIVRTGAANLASVIAALERMDGISTALVERPDEVRRAPFLILPGVGAFGPAMARLREQDLVEPLRERIDRGLPTLAICLGLQLLCRESEEAPGVRGLGVIDDAITRFDGSVRIPQLGWNRVEPDPGFAPTAVGHAYFANSYRLVERPPGWTAAWSQHAGRFIAAIRRGSIVACQFHPELSGAYGRAILADWLTDSSSESDAC